MQTLDLRLVGQFGARSRSHLRHRCRHALRARGGAPFVLQPKPSMTLETYDSQIILNHGLSALIRPRAFETMPTYFDNVSCQARQGRLQIETVHGWVQVID